MLLWLKEVVHIVLAVERLALVVFSIKYVRYKLNYIFTSFILATDFNLSLFYSGLRKY